LARHPLRLCPHEQFEQLFMRLALCCAQSRFIGAGLKFSCSLGCFRYSVIRPPRICRCSILAVMSAARVGGREGEWSVKPPALGSNPTPATTRKTAPDLVLQVRGGCRPDSPYTCRTSKPAGTGRSCQTNVNPAATSPTLATKTCRQTVDTHTGSGEPDLHPVSLTYRSGTRARGR
jgi:hypothetical protein